MTVLGATRNKLLCRLPILRGIIRFHRLPGMIWQEIVLKIPRITIHEVRGMVHRIFFFFELYELLTFFESPVPNNIHGFVVFFFFFLKRNSWVQRFRDMKFLGSWIFPILKFMSSSFFSIHGLRINVKI